MIVYKFLQRCVFHYRLQQTHRMVFVSLLRRVVQNSKPGNFTSLMSVRKISESKASVNGVSIYYEKVGTGNHPVLLIPGALGSTKTDFEPQLQKLNQDLFTIIGFDPRGYGKSRPPDRDFPFDFLYRDADDAASLMKVLGFEKYSVLGWSDGGNSACMLAAKWPERVKKLVVWGSNSYFSNYELELYKGIRDLDKWSARMKQPMIEVYGKAYFEKTWHKWVDVFCEMSQNADENGDTDLYKNDLSKIKADTLIVHGMKDALVPKFQPDYLHKHIQNSRLVCWDDGKHNLHLKFVDKFNALVEQFLTSTSKL